MSNGQFPIQNQMQFDPKTVKMIAGTAIMLLDQFCQSQSRGQRILFGDSNYTILENGKNLDIHFRGDQTREPTTILQLRTQTQDGRTRSVITTNLSSEDVDRFARINQALAHDLQQPSRSPSIVISPKTPKSEFEVGE
jgi:hypothetical protein